MAAVWVLRTDPTSRSRSWSAVHSGPSSPPDTELAAAHGKAPKTCVPPTGPQGTCLGSLGSLEKGPHDGCLKVPGKGAPSGLGEPLAVKYHTRAQPQSLPSSLLSAKSLPRSPPPSPCRLVSGVSAPRAEEERLASKGS